MTPHEPRDPDFAARVRASFERQLFMSGVVFVPGASGRSLVAVGLAGTARSDDAGETWTMVDSVAYNTVMFATRDDGWAVGPRGRIAKWTPTLPVRKP